MPLDEYDMEFIAAKAHEALRKARKEGIPVKQVSEDDLKEWVGTNVQSQSGKPAEDQQTVAIYLIDVNNKAVKRFTATKALDWFLMRNSLKIAYGTTTTDGRQIKVILQWEKERREKP